MNRIKTILIALSFLLVMNLQAQNIQSDNNIDYNRSSLYNLSLLHPATKMYDEILSSSLNLSQPEKYNDHCLSLRIILASSKKKKDIEVQEEITKFLAKNQIAKRLVSKWYNRDKEKGNFNVNLLTERGNYNADPKEMRLASLSARGKAIIEDAGEQLINNTFVLVNDISYYDKEAAAQTAKAVFQAIAMVASAASGISGSGNVSSIADMTESVANLSGMISNSIAGFTVNITTYLYRLKWDENVATTFYENYYYDDIVDINKKNAYEKDKNLFKLEYVGSYDARSTKTVLRGIHKNSDVFKKVLSRAIDNNIVELQKKFPIFQVTSTISEVDNNNIKVQIGLKEGVSPSSKYEVLERVMNADGKYSYHRKGVIKPIKNHIWDNRCMAYEEKAKGSHFNATTFEIISGSGFHPGMLVREIKFN